ncbi:MAG: sensor histidine kinase [Acholeplasmataceae bacterium]
MRNEIVRKNLIITTVILIMFFMISLFISSYFNKKSLEKQLINISTIVKEQLYETKNEDEVKSVVNLYVDKQSYIEVAVINSSGVIIYHSASDEIYQTLSSEEMKHLGDPNDMRKTYQQDDSLYMIIKVTDDLYLKTSMVLTNETTYILNSVFFMLAILIVFFMVSYIVNNKIANNVIITFKNIETHLKKINTNEYESIKTETKFEEVKESLKEINEISLNINKLIQTNQQERDKIKFVIDRMQQGLFVISKNNDFLLLNEFATNLFNDSDINSPIDLPSKIKEKIQESFMDKKVITFDYVDEEHELIYNYHLYYMDSKWDIEDKDVGIVMGVINDVTSERNNQELKTEFITNATHELKTPITSITGFSELLSSGLVTSQEQQQEMIEKIHQVAIGMKLTVENLLFLTTLEDTNTIHLGEDVLLKDVILNSIDKYYNEALNRSIKIIPILEDNILTGNVVLISYLVNNLLENAIRYNIDKGTITITNASDDEYIYFKIKDTGKGLDKKEISKIFEKFYRVPQEGQRTMGSTGIGLSIVSRIAYLHGAKIEVESKIDQGSQFTVKFNKKQVQ